MSEQLPRANQELCEAVWTGNVERTIDLLNHGANIECFNENGNTPLHLAVEQMDTALVELLLSRGADVNRRDRLGGWTPLIHAAEIIGDAAIQAGQRFDNQILQLLLQHRPDVNQRSWKGHNALHFATTYGNAEAVSLLRDAGATE